MSTKNPNKEVTIKRLNSCLNIVKQCIEEKVFTTPEEALDKMMNTFFNFSYYQINKDTRKLTVCHYNNKIKEIELKRDFIDLLYPEDKEKREQLPGQLCLDDYITTGDNRSEIEKSYDDDYFFEEKDR